MKHILILIFCIVAAFQASAQVQYRYGATAADTSGASQTHYIYPGTNTIAGTTKYKEGGDLEVLVSIDSLSGTTGAGIATIQYAYDDSAAPVWYSTSATVTIGSGAVTNWQIHLEDNSFTALKWRVKLVNSSGTQSNRMIAYYTWKRRV